MRRHFLLSFFSFHGSRSARNIVTAGRPTKPLIDTEWAGTATAGRRSLRVNPTVRDLGSRRVTAKACSNTLARSLARSAPSRIERVARASFAIHWPNQARSRSIGHLPTYLPTSSKSPGVTGAALRSRFIGSSCRAQPSFSVLNDECNLCPHATRYTSDVSSRV